MSVAELGQYTEPVYCIDSFHRVICRYKSLKTVILFVLHICIVKPVLNGT
jgi:hypothetical protein